jgi:hypothetical protein
LRKRSFGAAQLKIKIWHNALISLNIYFNYIIVIIMAFDLQNLRKEFQRDAVNGAFNDIIGAFG